MTIDNFKSLTYIIEFRFGFGLVVIGAGSEDELMLVAGASLTGWADTDICSTICAYFTVDLVVYVHKIISYSDVILLSVTVNCDRA